jgi:hypothetical protein
MVLQRMVEPFDDLRPEDFRASNGPGVSGALNLCFPRMKKYNISGAQVESRRNCV